MLVLFDIDATLIKTSRACLYAMSDGFEDTFGKPCSLEGIQYAGRLDPVILTEVMLKNAVSPSPERLESFRNAYRGELKKRLDVPGTGYLLEGAAALVDTLKEKAGLTLGLLTGNFEDTGRMKLKVCGLDTTPFVVNAFGDESPHHPPLREHLVELAMERYHSHRGRKLKGSEVVIIGDSPHDVQCARAHDCHALAVATGLHDREHLLACGADLAVDSLADTPFLADWIMSSLA